jgi:hypothetical protein
MPRFEFTISLSGCGDTPEQAWLDAVDALHSEPGDLPSEYYEATDDDEDEG